MPGDGLSPDPAGIAGVAAFVISRVAVQNFAIVARSGDTDPVVAAHYRRKIADHHHKIVRIFGAPDERKNAAGRIVRVDPFESRPFEIDLEQGRLAGVQMIQILDEALHPAVRRRIFQRPIHAAFFPEFVALGQLAAHEQQFLAGVRVHVAEKQTQVCKLLPVVARHFFQQGALAVDDFIMRER